MTQAVWFNDAKTTEEKDSVKQDLALAYRAFQRLERIIKSRVRDNPSFNDYDITNWPFYQADVNGYNRALKEILKLIKTKED